MSALADDGSYTVTFDDAAPPGRDNDWCSHVVFTCVGLTWLHRFAQIGSVRFTYETLEARWSGRALVGPDGCEFFDVTSPGRIERDAPHFRVMATRACIDYLMLKGTQS